jgi:hypothetical protein
MSGTDLSDEIIRTIKRRVGERVTCTRVAQNYYRCNWWSPRSKADYDNPEMPGSLATTGRICRSQFLRAEMLGERLDISVIASGGGEDAVGQIA